MLFADYIVCCLNFSINMPAKNTSQRPGTQTANNGPDSPRKRKYSLMDGDKKDKGVTGTVSFEVYQSEAATFLSIGEYRKAINSYTTVSVQFYCVYNMDLNWCINIFTLVLSTFHYF